MNSRKQVFRAGIDLGGTKITVSVLDRNYKPLATAQARNVSEEGRAYLLETTTGLLDRALAECGLETKDLASTGIACPGVVNEDLTTVIGSPTLPFLSGYALASQIGKRTGVPTIVANDVNMGLYGEHQFGAARGLRHAVGIFLETGIGGALILDGKLYCGAFGAAGEFGHIFMNDMSPRCGCGNYGCLEALASRTAISAEAATLAARGEAPALLNLSGGDVRRITSKVLKLAIDQGDAAIAALIRRKTDLIGIALGSVINIIDPQAVIVGGKMVEVMPELVLEPITASINRFTYCATFKRKVKLLKASLGTSATMLGAAKMSEEKFR
ncbi:MAG: ROK family protein [Elusimicrobiaceae bacterium]|nr:ROK family protein [Elusimicrobiaceae bacterium]